MKSKRRVRNFSFEIMLRSDSERLFPKPRYETDDRSLTPSISFNISKKETYTPSNGFKTIQRRLRTNYKITQNKEEMNLSKLRDHKLLVFGAPTEKFSTAEVYLNLTVIVRCT